MAEENSDFLDDFELLTQRGVVGLFDHFEVIEIVQYTDGSSEPRNVLTLAVAHEGGVPEATRPLNNERIRLNKLKGCNFGVFRSVCSIDVLHDAICTHRLNGTWQPSSVSVSIGKLTPVLKQFVPPNSATRIPLNCVLKNNFFSGSYVLELFDIQKSAHTAFEQNPLALQELSERISELVPIQIASLSDRLGNLLIQFPIDAIRTEFKTDGNRYRAEIAWHPDIQPRELIVTAQADFDRSFASFSQAVLRTGSVSLGGDPDHGTLNGFVWDSENSVLLAATGEMAFIKNISANVSMGIPEPRTVPRSIEDAAATERVRLSSWLQQSNAGGSPDSSIRGPVGKRIYDDERARLSQQRQFVQYAATPGTTAGERERALADVRALIVKNGAGGVWLWDPYLTPQDLLDTLFYNTAFGAPMRGLTALKVHEAEPSVSEPTQVECRTKGSRIRSYRETLTNMPGNRLGLNMEFRAVHGPRGWKFHDRFLIFPKSEYQRTQAWSLGTSVNSLGKSHHILQQADNAQLIAEAFQLLWDAVDHTENLVWKCP